jgi:hypothetical protein
MYPLLLLLFFKRYPTTYLIRRNECGRLLHQHVSAMNVVAVEALAQNAMVANGTKQTSESHRSMSAFRVRADIAMRERHVRS